MIHAHKICPTPWKIALATDKEYMDSFFVFARIMHTIVDKNHPEKLKKNADENNPENNKLTINTLKNPNPAYSFLPKKYKTINPIVFANPSFTPGIETKTGR